MIKSEEFRRGYEAGYKQALLDALKQQTGSVRTSVLGGPHAPKPGGLERLDR